MLLLEMKCEFEPQGNRPLDYMIWRWQSNSSCLMTLLDDSIETDSPTVAAGHVSPGIPFSKDAYGVHERERILAYIGVIMALAPMLAPVLGGWVLTWFSWRWVFVIQSAIGTIAWIGVFRMPETLKTPVAAGALQTAGIYLQLLSNRRYMGFALMMSLVVLPIFAFIGGIGMTTHWIPGPWRSSPSPSASAGHRATTWFWNRSIDTLGPPPRS
jgi:MFS family permease